VQLGSVTRFDFLAVSGRDFTAAAPPEKGQEVREKQLFLSGTAD